VAVGGRTITQEEIRKHAVADPCDECESDELWVRDLQPDYRRVCTVALVQCMTCGHEHRRDIPDAEGVDSR
jgi:DNA-directed RNA polymerase subunit M/transcription elongation factor TFIIS